MNEINIRELFKIDDSHSKIRGFITLLDENGNVERAAENMIVESGRELMFNALTGGDTFSLTENLSAALINSVEQTTSDMTYDKVGEICQETVKLEMDKDSEPLCIKFTLTYEPTKSGKFSGIILYKTDDNTLFSRVIFPEYSHTSSKKYTINYYIYF